MTAAITVAAFGVAVLLIAITVVGLTKVDESWRAHHRTCCRCRRCWFGTEKLCDRCGARGHTDPPVEVRTPAHDWQGSVDTAAFPVVPVQIPQQRDGRHALREDREVAS